MLRAMLRLLAIAAMFALAMPVLAVAQEHEEHHPGGPAHPGGPPHPGPAPGARPVIVPHGPPGPPAGPMAGPHPAPLAPLAGPHPGGGPPGGVFSYRGHMIGRVHLNPFAYPPGYVYRRWEVGAALPPVFLAPDYFYADWAALGLDPPPPGYQWVRYGPDLLLVDVNTGEIAQVAYDVFD